MDKQLRYQILLDLRNRIDAGAREAQAALDRVAGSAENAGRRVSGMGSRTSLVSQSMVREFRQAQTAITAVGTGLTQVSYNSGRVGNGMTQVASATKAI